MAVCTARVRVFDAQNLDVVTLETSGIGDADPSNVSPMMKGHLLRMAETRAKARALRDAVNVGMAALEELGPEEAPAREPAREPGPVASAWRLPRWRASPSKGSGTRGRRWSRRGGCGRAEAERLGIALPGDVASLVAEQAPLPVLVGATQQLRKLTEATQAGQR